MKCFRKLFALSFLFYFHHSSAQISGIVNEYRRIIAIDSAKGIMKLSNAGDMTQYIGRTAMIIQMKGATIVESDNSSFGNISSINQAGNFEFGTICGQQSDTIIFENKLNNFYNPAGFVQLVVLPKYTNVTITDTLKAKSWDPVSGTGGVLAIEASDTVFLNAPVDADGAGFRGGLRHKFGKDCSDNNFPLFGIYTCPDFYLPLNPSTSYKHGGKKGESISEYLAGKEYARGKQANGGGGGNNSNQGGGGGSNYGAGGNGGSKTGTSTSCTSPNPGIGGLALNVQGYSSAYFRIFAGGGGGAGDDDDDVSTSGGHGGGIVYIKSNVLVSSNQEINAAGSIPYNSNLSWDNGNNADLDGGGGGGGGGVVIINSKVIIGNLRINVNGGKGSATGTNPLTTGNTFCTGPGGGGGGGVAWLATVIIPPSVTVNVAGGANGIVKNCGNVANGASPGGTGIALSGFVLPAPRDSSPVCKAILPQSLVISFKGYEDRLNRRMELLLNDKDAAAKVSLERSSDGRLFSTVTTMANNGRSSYSFIDNYKSSIVYYRAMVLKQNGARQYSAIISFRESQKQPELSIFPNPTGQRLLFRISVKERELVNATILDQSGKAVSDLRLILHPLEENYALPLNGLPRGIYQLVLAGDGFKQSARFTKL